MNKIYFEKPNEFQKSTISEVYYEKDAVLVFIVAALTSNGANFLGLCKISDKLFMHTGYVLNHVSIGSGINIRSDSIRNDYFFFKDNFIGGHVV